MNKISVTRFFPILSGCVRPQLLAPESVVEIKSARMKLNVHASPRTIISNLWHPEHRLSSFKYKDNSKQNINENKVKQLSLLFCSE